MLNKEVIPFGDSGLEKKRAKEREYKTKRATRYTD